MANGSEVSQTSLTVGAWSRVLASTKFHFSSVSYTYNYAHAHIDDVRTYIYGKFAPFNSGPGKLSSDFSKISDLWISRSDLEISVLRMRRGKIGLEPRVERSTAVLNSFQVNAHAHHNRPAHFGCDIRDFNGDFRISRKISREISGDISVSGGPLRATATTFFAECESLPFEVCIVRYYRSLFGVFSQCHK